MTESPRPDPTKGLPSERSGYWRLSALLNEYEDRVVETWMEFVGDQVASHSVGSEDLEDAIRSFLAHVRDGLEQGHQKAAPAAIEHGRQRHRVGFHLASMVAEYGLLLQAVEKVALEVGVEITMAEFAALAGQVVAGVADATSSFVETQRGQREEQARRHYGFLAHELRNPIQNMGLAVTALRADPAAVHAIDVLDRALTAVRDLIDRSLVDAQRNALGGEGPSAQPSPFDLMELVRDIVSENEAHGSSRSIEVLIEGPATLDVSLDRGLMRSVVTNLIRNAIKFSCDAARVRVRVRARSERVHIEVEDKCGGLPEGAASTMFEPFAQMGTDRTGFGLGLAITQQAVNAHHGRIQVHDVEGACVFVVDLPQHYDPNTVAAVEAAPRGSDRS